MPNVVSPLPPLCEDTESKSLMDMVPHNMCGAFNNWFVDEARKGKTAERVVEAVRERLSGLPKYADLLTLMIEHPEATKAQAQQAVAYVTLPEAERKARQQEQQAAAKARYMASHPPTPSQLACLRSLGDTGPRPATMQEASQRITALSKGNRV